MSKYEEALKKYRQAERECLAELFNECCPDDEDPHVMDEDGHWMTKQEVYERLLRGDN